MAIGSSAVIHDIQTLFHLGTTGSESDAELLERFLARRDGEAETAFAAVVARHGPMVLRVCRRILPEPNDAEDAFQVTFLVLARKAKAIARRKSLANWLYGVAVRSARELRSSAARRREREEQMKERLRADVAANDDVPNAETMSAIDDELGRLPASFRAVVILCDLEDKTHKEAARILGVPVGTVSSRLVRARGLLRTRLARRGFDPSAADQPRDRASTSVPPLLVATTARAAAQFAARGNLVGIVPTYLATATESVVKSMLLAKLTCKGMIIATIVFFSVAAAGGASYSLRGTAGALAFGTSGPAEDAWAWVDSLRNADEATRERLKRCAASATSNFASIHRLIFDYNLRNESPQLPLDASGKLKSVERGFSHGTVYWKEGIVRYDHFPEGIVTPDGRKFFFKRPWVQSVVRSREFFAYTQQDSVWGLLLTVANPPGSVAEWEQGGHAQLRYLDPLLHYAEPFCQDQSQLQELVERCRAVESEEAAGKVLLRFLGGGNNNFRLEITCEKAVDWLPTFLRSGDVRDGKWLVFVELKREWQKLSSVWYPTHQEKTSYIGVDLKPVKEVDLRVQNLRVNGAVNLPDSAFSLGGMDIPDGTPGFDTRQKPAQSLIRAGGVVRQPRPGEGRSPRNVNQEKAARQEVEETVPEDEFRRTAPQPAAIEPRGTVRNSGPKQEYSSLLGKYESARIPLVKAQMEGETDESRREAYLSLGRLEWSYAPRFLELALAVLLGRGHPAAQLRSLETGVVPDGLCHRREWDHPREG